MRPHALLGLAFVTAAAHGAVAVKKFPNGLTWIHRPVTHNRILAFELFIPGGIVDEPAEKAGITRLTAAAMVKGTASRSALLLAQTMESLGASFGVDAEPDFIAVGGQVIGDQWAETFDLFEDVLLHPSFPEAEVDKERASLLNDRQANQEHIFHVAEERFRKEMFGDHPYGRQEEGTEASLSGLTREDLVRWHGERVTPRGAVLVTVGNVPAGALGRRIEALARVWRSSSAVSSLTPPVVPPSAPRAAEESRSFEQAYVMMGFSAPGVGDDQYPAVKLVNALLGGGMSSPLFRAVREEGTLAYEVSSFYPSRRAGSAFVIYAGMDPKNLGLAESKIQSVVKDFLSAPPTAQDLQDA